MGRKLWKAVAGMALALTIMLFSNGMGSVEAANITTAIVACQINPDLQTVTVIGSSATLPPSDDGYMYLFAEPTYSGGITTNAIAAAPMNTSVAFTTELLQGQVTSRLYSKFVIATKQGGVFVPVSGFCHITNPEIIATHSAPRIVTTSKKGLNPNPMRLEELIDLGVQHMSYNVDLASIIGPTTNAAYPTITYVYNGVPYAFNGAKISEYDAIFGYATRHNISITAVLVTSYRQGYEFLLNPASRDLGGRTYYMNNGSEQVGVQYLSAICSFLASRYSNAIYGQVDNWVFGNEVPARLEWNYIRKCSLESYVEEYAKTLRIAYTAIRSENAFARVYTSVDSLWDRNVYYSFRYDTKDFLEVLNANICSQGNFDWGLACHPYPVPLTYAPFWTSSAYYRNLIRHNANSPYVSMENVEVLTDFMCQASMLSPSLQVRNIIVDEIGYTSVQGEKNQAAAYTYGYMQAAANQHIDAFILNSQSDHPAEIAQGMRLGLENADGTHKLAYDYFKFVDTPFAAPYLEAARQTIGFASWETKLIAR